MLRLELNKEDLTESDIDALGDIFGDDDVRELLEESDHIILQMERR